MTPPELGIITPLLKGHTRNTIRIVCKYVLDLQRKYMHLQQKHVKVNLKSLLRNKGIFGFDATKMKKYIIICFKIEIV